MSRDDWEIVRLQKAHRRDAFDCGSDELNEYIRRFARQNDRKGIGRVYVAVFSDETLVRGYYTLSNSAVEYESMPEQERGQLPRYPVPTVLIGRLAVDKSTKGIGLGRELLMHGIYQIIKAADQIGIYAVEVDAKDEDAKSFYGKYGFESLVDNDRHMFLSIKIAKRAFA